jgi:ABC-type proline/glycine betaine transport system substrate-binding protein
LRLRRTVLALVAAALLAASLTAGAATASAPPKPVNSNSVPVTGAVVTKVIARAAVKNNRLTVTLMPGKLPFAQRIVSLKGKISDWSASAIKISLKATGARKGTGTVTVTGPLNDVEVDIAVWKIDWTVATTNTGTLKLTPQGV